MNCRWWRLSGALALFLPAPIHAQSPARYRAGPPEYIQVVTSTTRTLVRGTDTLTSRTIRHSIIQRKWDNDGDGLRLILRIESPGPAPTVRTDTLRLTRTGQSRAEPGPAELSDPGARFDVVPRLPFPAEPLAPDTRWIDSLSVEGVTEGGRLHYEFGRRYTGRHWANTLGRRVLEVEGLGSMRYREGMLADSTSGLVRWLDVSGSERLTFWYEPARGRVAGRLWTAALSGLAGEPGDLGEDTLPVALTIRREERPVTKERAELLNRLLPQGDTLQTQRLGEVLALQTARRDGGKLALGMADLDGRVMTADLRLDRIGMPERFEGVWTDTAATDVRVLMRRRGRELDIGEGDANRVPLPATPWTIAEPGMEEALVPLLVRLPDDGQTHPIAVFRPLSRSWDNGTAVTRRQATGMLAVLQFDSDRVRTSLLIGNNGDLLFVQRGNEPMTARQPPAGSERAARLQELVSGMQ